MELLLLEVLVAVARVEQIPHCRLLERQI